MLMIGVTTAALMNRLSGRDEEDQEGPARAGVAHRQVFTAALVFRRTRGSSAVAMSANWSEQKRCFVCQYYSACETRT